MDATLIHAMWEHTQHDGHTETMVTWRATDGHTRVGYIVAEWAPGIYSARVIQSWKGQQIPTAILPIYADEITFAQYV